MQNLPYRRADRVSGAVFEVVAEVCLYELSDPRLDGVQITAARMTDDLQITNVYYYISGDEDAKKGCLKGLMSAKGYIKRAIAKRLDLRIVPDIRYFFDAGIENSERMESLLKDLDIGEGEDGK